MARQIGYAYTRKDKVFAEFDFDTALYTLKESHSSKGGIYKVGIYKDGQKVYKIDMSREQINRIKSNKGLANINFLSAEGFENFIETNYVNREFNEENFKKFFVGYYDKDEKGKEVWKQGGFLKRYGFLDTKEGFIGEVKYTSYLISLLPDFLLENLYEENKLNFQKVYKYELVLSTLDEDDVRQEQKNMVEGIKAQALQYLNVHEIPFKTKEEFMSQ